MGRFVSLVAEEMESVGTGDVDLRHEARIPMIATLLDPNLRAAMMAFP